MGSVGSCFGVKRSIIPTGGGSPRRTGAALLVDKHGFVKLLRRKVFVSTAVPHM
jgi:hypothetical protein